MSPGRGTPGEPAAPVAHDAHDAPHAPRSVARAIRAALLTADPVAKVMAARRLARDWHAGRLGLSFDVAMPDRPARPARPPLLRPGQMPKRGRG